MGPARNCGAPNYGRPSGAPPEGCGPRGELRNNRRGEARLFIGVFLWAADDDGDDDGH